MPIIAVIAFAAILRLWHLEQLTTFGGDQGYDLENIRQILQGNLTLLGPRIGPYNNVADLYLGPFYYYLLAPFVWFTKLDPIGASVAIVLSRLLTTLLIYLVARRLFGFSAGLIAAIISSLSPYWVNDLGPPSNPYFILPIMSSIIFLLMIKKKSLRTFGLIGFLAGLTLHLHYLSIIILIALSIYPLREKKYLHVKNIISMLLGLIISISPIILFEVRNGFFLTNQLLKQIATSSFNPSLTSLSLNITQALEFIARDTIGAGDSLVTVILLLTVVFLLLKKSQRKTKPVILFLASILILNIIAASLYFGQLQPHYLAAAYPAIFIFAALLISSAGKVHQAVPFFLIIVISVLLFQKNNFFSPSGYTMPEDLTLKEIRKISKIITSDVGSDSFNIASTLDGDARARPYRYLVEVYGKSPEDVEHYDNPDSLYVITRDSANVVPKNSLFEIASFQPSNISKIWEIKGSIRLVKLSKTEKINQATENFVVIVNPVRARDLWVDRSVENLKRQIKVIEENNLKATWLLQYDTLFDEELIQVLKSLRKNHELGAFLEISEKQATDSKVSYKVADGDYYRPDKAFLSGYSPQDRKKLLKTYFNKFQKTFGSSPKVVGAWYLDANSQNFLAQMGIKSALTVADQFDTDSASIWGKYFSMPFYPAKFNALEPAIKESNKIPIVNIQWAQRHPVLGYGQKIKDSRQSFQANDYVSNQLDFSYFQSLLASYLKNQKNDFMQITIGLEAGQEAVRFYDEFARQIREISRLSKNEQVKVATMGEFANWYMKRYPGISPSHFLTIGDSFWYMSPGFRVAIFKEGENYFLKDLRFYTNHPFRDYLYQDESTFLDRKVTAQVDDVWLQNKVDLGPAQKIEVFESFDLLSLKLDNKMIKIDAKGVSIDQEYKVRRNRGKEEFEKKLNYLSIVHNIRNLLSEPLKLLKYSTIDGQRVFGIAISRTKLLGIKGNSPGIYNFNFQSFAKFLSPQDLVEKWQPWIN